MSLAIGAAALLAGLALWFVLVITRASGRRLPPMWSSAGYPWSRSLTAAWIAMGAVGGLALTNGFLAYLGVLVAYVLVSAGVVAIHNSRLAPAER